MELTFKKSEKQYHDPSLLFQNIAYLRLSNWDDFGFKTSFFLTVFDEFGVEHEIGMLKIGYADQDEDWTEEKIPETFRKLNDGFFSLGQDNEYYQNLKELDPPFRKTILRALNDVVNDERLLPVALQHRVMRISLLREVSLTSVKGQYRRILQGGALLTEYNFDYCLPQSARVAGLEINFHVNPESNPPTNIHVLIGQNGVGKTHLLNNMVEALVAGAIPETSVGSFSEAEDGWGLDSNDNKELFAGLVSVAFSAFDPFEPYPENKDKTKGVRYSYVGLKRTTNRGGKKGTPMSRDMLTNEFVDSLMASKRKGHLDRWGAAIGDLESDILFRDLALADTILQTGDDQLESCARRVFKDLSSGHAIVLLTITKLVEKVEEKTLVLLDEPEAHLHPPLLSAFVRALSELLSHRNGVAIVATHSPVVLQEVPKNCVWKLRRSGLQANADRPEVETFGESIGVLTREVFGLEVEESGYHQLLKRELLVSPSYDAVLSRFGYQLGAEARGVLRGLISDETSEKEA